MSAKYDTIGINYAQLRKPDPRIAAQIDAALGDAKTVVNVGAGSGSYEPAGRHVTAVEPSAKMIAQRPPQAGPAIQGSAENLPFEDNAFDGAMAVNTVHHWVDKPRAFAEIKRVTRSTVAILTFDPDLRGFWLWDYFPELVSLDAGQMPSLENYEKWLGPCTITPVPVPHDCVDGFLCAYWRRPAAYLDERVRKVMSSFWMIDNVEAGLARLEADLESGAWEQKYGDLLDQETYDAGYRLVISNPG